MRKLVSLFFLSFVLTSVYGCSNDIVDDTSSLNVESFSLQSIHTREASITESENHYKGIQYDLILNVQEISEQKLAEIGVRLNFDGMTSEILGQNGAGYVKGFTMLDNQPGNKKIIANIMVIQSPPVDPNDLIYLLSDEGIRDLSATIYENDTAIADLFLN